MSEQPRLIEVLPLWARVVAGFVVVIPLLMLLVHVVTGSHVTGGGFGIAVHLLIPGVVLVSLLTLRARPRR